MLLMKEITTVCSSSTSKYHARLKRGELFVLNVHPSLRPSVIRQVTEQMRENSIILPIRKECCIFFICSVLSPKGICCLTNKSLYEELLF